MTDTIRIRPAEGTWVVRAGGAVLGESERALEVTEGDRPFVIYFPREDIATVFLDPSDTKATNPGMGEATHFSIVTKSTTLKDAVWSYESPKPAAADLKDYLAFHATEQVAVEQI